jgi:hypothetical protein
MNGKTTSEAGMRRVGWLWPVGLAILAFASAGAIWSGLLAAYDQIAPSHICYQLGVRYQVVSWTTFMVAVLGLFELTLLAAITLRANRTATMVLTTALTLPLILVASLVLYSINHGGICLPQR